MGEVVAVSAPDGRRLLLKRIPPLQLSDAVEIERFRREIRTLVSLELRGVPRIEAFDDDPGAPYLLMDWVDGVTLDHWIDELQALPLQERVEQVAILGESLARLLDEVHHVGVVHRDLSPRNILVRPNGEPVLLDFGLARHHQDSLLTQSGDFLGTLRYAPPEQVFASGRLEAGSAGDLYSLGLLLMEAITGCPVRTGQDSRELLRQALLVDPPDLAELEPGTPRAFCSMLAALLVRDPRYRYSRGGELAADLAAFRLGAPTPPAPRLPLVQRLQRSWRRQSPERRKRRAWAAGSAAALALLSGLTWVELPKSWARQAARSNSPAHSLPLLERASAWRSTPALLIQKSFTELAFGDSPKCLSTLADLQNQGGWELTGEALSLWVDEAAWQGSEWQRKGQSVSGEDYSWILQAVDDAVSRHPDNGWLRSWRAWIRLSYNDSPAARQDMAVATASLPDSVLVRRAEILAHYDFGADTEILGPMLASAREHIPDPEWDLWEALHLIKRGLFPEAEAQLNRAAPSLVDHDALGPILQALQAKNAFRSGQDPGGVDWLPTRDPLAQLIRRDALVGWGMAIAERQPDTFHALGFHGGKVRAALTASGPVEGPPPVIREEGHQGFTADFSTDSAFFRDFELRGVREQLAFRDGVLSLLPLDTEVHESRQLVPMIQTRRPPFPPGASWQLRARIRWTGTGNYGANLRVGPMVIRQDHTLRVSIEDETLSFPPDGAWKEILMVRDGDFFSISLGDQEVLTSRIPGVPVLEGINLGAGAPAMSVQMEIQRLEVKPLS